MSHRPEAQPAVRHAHVCPWCLEVHDSALVLCPTCEPEAEASRRRAGLPIRYRLAQPTGEEPDD